MAGERRRDDVLGELATSQSVARLKLAALSPAAVAQLAEEQAVDADELYRSRSRSQTSSRLTSRALSRASTSRGSSRSRNACRSEVQRRAHGMAGQGGGR